MVANGSSVRTSGRSRFRSASPRVASTDAAFMPCQDVEHLFAVLDAAARAHGVSQDVLFAAIVHRRLEHESHPVVRVRHGPAGEAAGEFTTSRCV